VLHVYLIQQGFTRPPLAVGHYCLADLMSHDLRVLVSGKSEISDILGFPCVVAAVDTIDR
jgi:hypothetical protein